jgi:hypothetical protein
MISKTISYLFCTRKKLKLLISLEVEAVLSKQVKLRLSRPYTNRIFQLEVIVDKEPRHLATLSLIMRS